MEHDRTLHLPNAGGLVIIFVSLVRFKRSPQQCDFAADCQSTLYIILALSSTTSIFTRLPNSRGLHRGLEFILAITGIFSKVRIIAV